MCMNFFKHLFGKDTEPGETENSVAITGSVVPVEEEITSGETVEEKPELPSPVLPYSGVDFHVLLDNGHASSTPGKRQQLSNGKYFFEYEFNRDVVRRIAEKLDVLGIPYEILVPEVDEDIALSTRAARANSFCTKYGTNNCFFISVHSNAYGDGKTFTSAKGWSVWTTKGGDKSDEYATKMFNVASEILPKYGMTTRADNSDNDPDYEENYTVIYKTWCPAILTENMFFTNKKEVEWLLTDEGRDAIAEIHVEGIKRIINSRQ